MTDNPPQHMETLSTPVISLPRHPNPTTLTVNNGHQHHPHPVFSLIKQCKNIKQLKQIHTQMLRTGLFFDPYSASKLFTPCALGTFSSLEYAREMFDQIPQPNLYTWNTLIRAYSSSAEPIQSFMIFLQLVYNSPYFPNEFTFPFVIKAAARLVQFRVGQAIHGMVIKSSFEDDLFISNSLIHFYAICGDLAMAYCVFVMIGKKDVVSWNSMISGFVQGGFFEKAIELYREMEMENVKPDEVTMVAVLSACAKKRDLEFGRWPNEALSIFHELQLSKNVNPDEFTFVSVLSACAQLGAMDIGVQIHAKMKKQGIKLNCYLTTSLIDMYTKCGNLDKALEVFHTVKSRDVFVWSTMIAGFAMYGCGREALDLFSRMQEAKVKPNAVTFTNVLCACSHSGLVDEGRMFFNQMEPVYGVVPGVKHYTCMVDMLGRAGLLDEAVEFIEKMPIVPGASVWGALLGACKIHENVELAEYACSHLLELEPENHGALVLLSNIYAKTGKWDNVSELRKHMRVSGLKKEPGCSSIEVNGEIHKFLAGESSHPLCKEIYSKLDEIVARLKSFGYVPNRSHLLQLVEEEDVQEQALNLHSERLAIAYGLISVEPSQPIRIVKNLRVCGDCHTVAKLISKLYNREILLRDRYRFHHFRGGNCSCMDYW
ncbi:hypothetical protein CISIN_1g035659mg [Citrus sinensis]|uniref:DYW domain-containing protein n=1 Tax=Citrus sinensis TaxID=2711 RepID=A0A067DRQ6_CITSI|nr:hypothetical protein CISIN_1g035659mg [Citrus sinensis]